MFHIDPVARDLWNEMIKERRVIQRDYGHVGGDCEAILGEPAKDGQDLARAGSDEGGWAIACEGYVGKWLC